jgi:hypothetical protein
MRGRLDRSRIICVAMHFFIDHTALSTLQSGDDGFGPAPTDLSNVYNVTSRFQLTSPAKAFACEAGMMVVQRSVVDPANLVNLIIKPNANVNALADVQYYVYRGVLKDSLIAASGMLQHTGADNELLTRVWAHPPRRYGQRHLGL